MADPADDIKDDDTKPKKKQRRKAGDCGDDAFGIVVRDGVSWVAALHSLSHPRLLTEDDPRSPDPPGFKGRLFPPQATLLFAMHALENAPVLKLNAPVGASSASVQPKIGRLSPKFSFGKTVLTLSLVCMSRVPRRLPEPIPLFAFPSGTGENRAVTTTGSFDASGVGFLPSLTLRYKRLLPLTIVAAAANVITQWAENATRFTNLRYFIVEHVRSLRAFEELYRTSPEADLGLDLLLIKVGRVTSNFTIDGEVPLVSKAFGHNGEEKAPANRSLIGALGLVLDGVTIARLVVDDFDTVKLMKDDPFVPALFTWIVSATRRRVNNISLRVNEAPDVVDFIRSNSVVPITSSSCDDILNNVVNLNCEQAYIDAHLSSTAITFRRVFIRGGNVAAAMNQLGADPELIEMVNAGALGAAAAKLGIHATSPADVIRRVLGNRFEHLHKADRALARIAPAKVVLAAKPGRCSHPGLISDLRAALKDGNDDDIRIALAAMPGGGMVVETMFTSLTTWAKEERDKHIIPLARMRDNIREGACQCCMVPFEGRGAGNAAGAPGGAPTAEAEPAYILAGCCQIIVCEPCISVRDEGYRNAQGRTYIQRCPNCAKDLDAKTGLIRVGTEINLEAALGADAVAVAATEAEEAAKAVAAKVAAEKEAKVAAEKAAAEAAGVAAVAAAAEVGKVLPPAAIANAAAIAAIADERLRAFVQVVLEAPPECIRDETNAAPVVAGLLAGRRDVPLPPNATRRFLVYSAHAESTRAIEAALDTVHVKHVTLRGTRAQKDAAVKTIETGAALVMIVTEAKNSAGLNLPWITHFVFFHYVVDRNAAAQVAARGQRLGRTHNLAIISLFNEAEAEVLREDEARLAAAAADEANAPRRRRGGPLIVADPVRQPPALPPALPAPPPVARARRRGGMAAALAGPLVIVPANGRPHVVVPARRRAAGP